MNFDEDILLLLLVVCICQAVFLCQLPFKKCKKRKACVQESLRRREILGAYNTIASELQPQKIAIIIIHFGLHNTLLSLTSCMSFFLYFSVYHFC